MRAPFRPLDVLPEKATARREGRRLVYLDQSVLSNVARRRLGRDLGTVGADPLRALCSSLRAAIFDRQDARCVESFFHLDESSALLEGDAPRAGATDLFAEIGAFLKLHSWGLQLRGLHDTLERQSVISVVLASGALYSREHLWSLAFTSDPQKTNEAAGVMPGGTAFLAVIPWRPQVIDPRGWAARVETARAAGRYASLSAATRELGEELRERDLALNENRSWARLSGSGPFRLETAAVAGFIKSARYTGLPVNDVLIKVAARVLSNRARPLQDSDKIDMHSLALALPYCDLVVVDRFVANIVREAKLESLYGVVVVPGTDEGLRRAAEWLDQPLGMSKS